MARSLVDLGGTKGGSRVQTQGYYALILISPSPLGLHPHACSLGAQSLLNDSGDLDLNLTFL